MADGHSLNSKASQETLISLLQLDPAPIDYDMEKELPPLPEEDGASTTGTSSASTLGLSGSGGRGPIFYLSRVQRYSSYAFTVFAGLHLANTSLVPLLYQSVPYAEPFLLLARETYQTPSTEPLLAGAILAHVGSGIALRLVRRSQNLRRYGGSTPGMWALHSKTQRSDSSLANGSRRGVRVWPPVSYVSISGVVFTGLLAAHVGINRVLPLIVEGDSSNIGLQYVSHAFARQGPPPWVAYSLLLSIGVGHMVWGWATWLAVAPPTNWKKVTVDRATRKKRRRAWWAINGAVVVVAGVWAAGGLGVIARAGPVEGWLGTVYDGILARGPGGA